MSLQFLEQMAARIFGPELAFIAILAAVLFGTAKAAQYFKTRNSKSDEPLKQDSSQGKS